MRRWPLDHAGALILAFIRNNQDQKHFSAGLRQPLRVMPALVAGVSILGASRYHDNRDGRDKPGHGDL
jgi:hypothetical protein